MKAIRAVLMFALIIMLTQLVESQAIEVNQSLSKVTRQSDERYIIGRLHSTLASTGFAARLYFHGACEVGGSKSVQFPLIDVFSSSEGVKGVQAVREMFRNDKSVTVSVDSSNIIRITIGNVYMPILKTRLSSIKLTTSAQYNPGSPGGAIDILESTLPVQAAMREFGMHQEPAFYIGLEQPPLRELPHLPPSMNNLELDQALDAIAKKFPGVVVYGECENHDKSHTFGIRFDWYPSQ